MAKVKKLFFRRRGDLTEVRLYAHAARGGEYILAQVKSPTGERASSMLQLPELSGFLKSDRERAGA